MVTRVIVTSAWGALSTETICADLIPAFSRIWASFSESRWINLPPLSSLCSNEPPKSLIELGFLLARASLAGCFDKAAALFRWRQLLRAELGGLGAGGLFEALGLTLGCAGLFHGAVSKLYLFADEAGDFAFKRGPNVSRYYVVCTVLLRSCEVGSQLLELRRRLAWEKAPLGDYFHACKDKQAVRDTVFAALANVDFEVHATIMEKSKAQPQVRVSEERFYKYGWHYHMQWSSGRYLTTASELMITVASIGTKRKRTDFEDAVRDVVSQKIPRKQWISAFWPCQTDPCLQVADYCTWAIQRKWESGGTDTRSYDLIAPKIKYEYDLWRRGNHHYY